LNSYNKSFSLLLYLTALCGSSTHY